MSFRKTLSNVALSTGLGLGLACCGKDYSQYVFNGKIGEDSVIVEEGRSWAGEDSPKMTIKKTDGREIRYSTNRGSVNKVEVHNGKDRLTYFSYRGEVDYAVIADAQKMFREYLDIIIKEKTDSALAKVR